MRRRRRASDILLFLLIAAVSVLVYSCRTTQDLVLEDPAFRYDMVEGAIKGTEYKITPEDYPEIRKLFSDDRPSYRLAGVILAEQSGSPLFHPLIAQAALDADTAVADRAVEAMNRNPEAYRSALRTMLDEGDAETRRRSLLLITEIGDEDIIPYLIGYYEDPDATVRNQATISVRTLTDSRNPFLRDALESDSVLTRAMAIRTLGGYEDPGDVDVFIAAFDATDSLIRREAQLATLRLGPAVLPALHIQAEDAANPYRVRMASLDVIQGIRSPDSLEVLIGLLLDPDPRISGKAASVLGTYGSEAVPALDELYRRGSGEYRVQAVRLLGEIAAPSAYPILASALGDESAEIRRLAYDSLFGFGEEAWPVLRNRLAGENPEVVSGALNLLLVGRDPWLARLENGEVNTDALFLLITLLPRPAIAAYLSDTGARALVTGTVLVLKDAWEAGDEFAELERSISSGTDPYLYTWRRREQLSVESREVLKQSFERLHDYFDTRDPAILDEASSIREESRQLEAEARALAEEMNGMDPAVQARGLESLESYRQSRDFLVRTWEYIIPELQPLADRVYADRNLDPDALSRESALLD